jgi:predicted HTH domain antitoxin
MNNYPHNKSRKAIMKFTEGSVSPGKASEISGLPKRLGKRFHNRYGNFDKSQKNEEIFLIMRTQVM